MESCLNDVMIGFVELAEHRKAKRQEEERQQLERIEAEGRRLVAAERWEREKDRRHELQRQLQAWSQARDVRTYIKVLQEAAKEHVIKEPEGRLARWLLWARVYADRIDPLASVSALPLDPEGYAAKPLDLDDLA